MDANAALREGRPVPFFLIKNYQARLDLKVAALPVAKVVSSLKETPGYPPELEKRHPGTTEGVPRGIKRPRQALADVEDDDLEGVTHRIQHWIHGSDETPFIRLDEEKVNWRWSSQGQLQQASLLKKFKSDAQLPLDKYVAFDPNFTAKSVFLPLLNSTNHVGQEVLDNWREMAAEVESKAVEVLRGARLLEEDFLLWSDLIKNAGSKTGELPFDVVGEGFGALRPEAFVKTGLCVTLEHHEHLGSTSVNVFPCQRPGEVADPSLRRPANLWRGWLLEDLGKAIAPLLPPAARDRLKDQSFSRADFHAYYTAKWRYRDLEFSRYLIETLKVPTFFLIQEEGDMVMTTHLGSHDVVYFGGPSYQVSWNLGFSERQALRLLEAFKYPKTFLDTGNDAANTPCVLQSFLQFCWPGPAFFPSLQPAFSKLAVDVSIHVALNSSESSVSD